MRRKVTKFYKDELLVADLGEGRLTLAAVARKHGLGQAFVSRVRRGKARPELLPRIRALRRAILAETERMVLPLLKTLLARQTHVALNGRRETARKCREHLLDRFLLGKPGHSSRRIDR